MVPRHLTPPLCALLVVSLMGCGSAAASTATSAGSTALPGTGTPPPGKRPASPVEISILQPTPGEVVYGDSVHVVVSISGGTIVPYTSSHITPTTGHIHIYLDGQLYYMSYSTQATIPLQPGHQYQIYAEWVASDHFPFDPRDTTTPFYFTVEPAGSSPTPSP
jgi:hypothetical protein